MILLIGGRAAGKKAHALSQFGQEAQVCSPEQALQAPCIDQLQLLIRQLLDEGRDVMAFVEELIQKNPEALVLCDEVGQGIVPLHQADRAWREAVGRACTRLAAASDQVIRLVCGLPQRLK